MVSLSSTAEMLRAMSAASNVTFSAYVLWPKSEVRAELEKAAARGARVTVRLNGHFNKHNGTPAMLCDNIDGVSTLQALHADAKLVHLADNDGPPMHIKAVVCDGVAFLDDRNWVGSSETVVKDDDCADVKAIRGAVLGTSAHRRSLYLDKGSALTAEARLVGCAHDRVEVATEELGASPVFYALRNLAKRGKDVHLLVSRGGGKGTYRDYAQQLKGAGVHVRVMTRGNDKYAVSRDFAWLGSANATSVFADASQTEWGLRTRDPVMIRALESRFNNAWKSARRL